MANFTVTPAQVDPLDDAVFVECEAGAAIAVGEAAYQDASDSYKAKLADANASAAAAAAKGIAVSAASAAGQRVTLQTGGGLTLGADATASGLAETVLVCLSATPGKLAPYADLASGSWLTVLGVGRGSNAIDVRVWATGRQKA